MDFLTALKSVSGIPEITTAGVPEPGLSLSRLISRRLERVGTVVLREPALLVILDGVKHVEAGGATTRFRPGQAFLVPAGPALEVVNEPDPATGLYRVLILNFPRDLVMRAHRAHPGWFARGGPPAIAPGPARAVLEVPVTPTFAATLLHAVRGLAGAGDRDGGIGEAAVARLWPNTGSWKCCCS